MSPPRKWSAELLHTPTEEQRALYFELLAAMKVAGKVAELGEPAAGAGVRVSRTFFRLVDALTATPGSGADALLRSLMNVIADDPEGLAMLTHLAAPPKKASS